MSKIDKKKNKCKTNVQNTYVPFFIILKKRMTHIFKVPTVITLQYETENEVEEERDGRQKQLILTF